MIFNRRSTVSLAGRTWGELRLGRDVMPHYWNLVMYDPFNHVGVGAAINAIGSVGGLTNSYVRASNSIQYFTPATLGGFYGWGAMFLGENARSGATTEKDGNGYSVRLGYDSAVFNVSGAAMRTKQSTTGDVSTWSLGGKFVFGSAAIMGVYNRDKVDGVAPDGRGGEIAAAMVAGPSEFKLAYTTYKTDAATTPKSTKLAAGVVYSLSKRTALYTTLAHMRNSGGALQAVGGAVAGANGKSTGLDLGIRHNF